MGNFTITTYPGYNESGKGQHATELIFAYRGNEGAMVWRLATGITPCGPNPSLDPNSNLLEGVNINRPSNMGIVAHSELTLENASESDLSMNDSCEFLDGRACVCTYQAYSNKEPMKAFACEGIEGVKRVLKGLYEDHYGVEV